jgi:hypothetical protein
MFRDESSHVIKKAKAKARKKALLSPDADGSSPDTEPRTSVTPEPRGKPLSLITSKSRSRKNPPGPLLNWDRDEDSLLPSPDSGSWPATPMIALLYSLNPTYQERGTAYFFSRYVTLDENGCHHRFDFVYDIWKPASLAPEHQVDGVLASMTAVGLIGLGNMTRSDEVLEAARKSYGTALRLTNEALKNPVEAVKDTTMLSVLILGLFEMLTGTTPKTMKAWQEHVNGAVALASMRGIEQFKTLGGVKMFLMLCYKVMTSCVQRQVPMPEPLVKLGNELSRSLDDNDPTWQITIPACKVLQARYDIKNGHLSEPQAILDQLSSIEDEFDTLLAKFPKSWQYRPFNVAKQHPAIFQGMCHVYPSVWYATLWNSIRSCRMLVLETILDEYYKLSYILHPSPIPDRYAEQFQKARDKLERMCGAILASVPQHVGLINSNAGCIKNPTPATTSLSSRTIRQTPSPPESPSTRPSSSSSEGSTPRDSKKNRPGPTLVDPTLGKNLEEEAERFMLLASATNSIVWPLYLVGMASICTQDMKTYVVQRLHAVYAETGQRQAEVIANMVEARGIPPSEWQALQLRPRRDDPMPNKEQQNDEQNDGVIPL